MINNFFSPAEDTVSAVVPGYLWLTTPSYKKPHENLNLHRYFNPSNVFFKKDRMVVQMMSMQRLYRKNTKCC
jgi:hypothetical protein